MDVPEFEIAFPGAHSAPKDGGSGTPPETDEQLLDAYSRTVVDVIKEAGPSVPVEVG